MIITSLYRGSVTINLGMPIIFSFPFSMCVLAVLIVLLFSSCLLRLSEGSLPYYIQIKNAELQKSVQYSTNTILTRR